MNILVTGSSRGLGKAIALAFGRGGHSVAVHYRTRRAEAEGVLGELHALGARADLFQADLRDADQCADLVNRAAAAWGRLDGLVNNVGATRDKVIANLSPEDWREALDVNLSGAFFCLQAAVKHMTKEKEGFVINIGSIVGARGAAGCANYAAAKAGLIGLTKAAAKELGRFNIRVNAVLPGFHLTEMGEQVPPPQREKVMAEHALGRATDRAELTRFVLLLAELKTVSGQVFNLDSRVL